MKNYRVTLLVTVGLTIAPRLPASPVVVPIVVGTHPHDSSAFTQGLVFDGTNILESTGLFEQSSLRRIDLLTGNVVQTVALPADEFGEGLAQVGNRLIQLTYRNEIAHIYNARTFAEIGSFQYDGEGWGLCYDGKRLIMSDGTQHLFFRDPDTFELLGQITVRDEGQEVPDLNELECVGSDVLANVWPTSWIFQIDAETGDVLTRIDARALLAELPIGADILNGIAYDNATERFLLAGKLWPKLFEVEIPLPKRPAEVNTRSCSISASAFHFDSGVVCMTALAAFAGRRWRWRAASRQAQLKPAR